MQRHTLYGVNPIAVYDLPPPLPPQVPHHPPLAIPADDAASVASSRANSVQPPEIDESRRQKPDRRLGRQAREKADSPAPRPNKTKASKQRDLPAVIIDFLAALPPAHMFDGATFHIDELLKLIRNANVPYPTGFIVNNKRPRGSDDDEGAARKRISG
jgi:hypothetical protein